LSYPQSTLLLREFHYDVLTSTIVFYLTIIGINNLVNIINKNVLNNDQFVNNFKLVSFFMVFIILSLNYKQLLVNRVNLAFTGSVSLEKYNELQYLQSEININSSVVFDRVSGGYFGKKRIILIKILIIY
jgi:hypothetical protein